MRDKDPYDGRRPIRCKVLPIDLSVERTNQKFDYAGYNLAVLTKSSGALCNIKFNAVTAENIALDKVKRIESHFSRFYITNSAQSGKTITLVIGEENFKLIPENPIKEPPEQQADAYLSQPNPVSGTEYTVLDTNEFIRIISISANLDWTVQPALYVTVTIDGNTIIFSHPLPATGVDHYARREAQNNEANQTLDETTDWSRGFSFLLEGRSVRVTVRRTGGTVSLMACRVKYAKWS